MVLFVSILEILQILYLDTFILLILKIFVAHPILYSRYVVSINIV